MTRVVYGCAARIFRCASLQRASASGAAAICCSIHSRRPGVASHSATVTGDFGVCFKSPSARRLGISGLLKYGYTENRGRGGEEDPFTLPVEVQESVGADVEALGGDAPDHAARDRDLIDLGAGLLLHL